MPDISTLDEQDKWILRLLYAPQKNNAATAIGGRTRLVKGIFLIDRLFREKFPEFQGTGYAFEAYKYGPFDKDIYDRLERMEANGLIQEVPTGEYEGDEIRLTSAGEAVAEDTYTELRPDYQSHLSWIKGRHVQQPVAQLLSYVYNKYPDMAERSEYSA